MIKIYKITNTENGYVYIGQTSKTLKERFYMHLKPSNKENRDNLLYKDISNFGKDCFTIEKIDECFDRHKFIIEKHWINEYLKNGFPMYNKMNNNSEKLNRAQKIAKARANNDFDYYSDEFKQKISAVTTGENNGMYGRTGKNAVNGQGVIAFDDNMNVVHEFVSVRHCLEFLGVKGHAQLNRACKNNTKYKGYYWKKQWKNFKK